MWAEKELNYINFNDLRLTARLEKMLEDFMVQPSGSIPEACQSKAATKAAYRFFSNENVQAEAIKEGLCKGTIERMNEYPIGEIFLFSSDATNIVFSNRKMNGIGVLRSQRARGLNLHTTLVSTQNELVLGLVNQVCWGRKPEDYGKRALRSKKPIEEKESYRWIQSLKAAQEALPDNNQGIFIGDRGADIYELFLEPRKANMNLLIRALHDRELANSSLRMFDDLENSPSMGIMKTTIERSGNRKERLATLDIRFKKITISPPKNKKNLDQINLCIISAKEFFDDPSTQSPVNWRLISTCSINSLEEAIHAVETYSKRWIIERYYYTLKEGCKVEELQFEEANRVDKAIAVYTIIACRLMYLTYLARITPESSCAGVFDNDTWKALCCYANKTSIAPKKPPSLRQALLMIAQLGGFVGGKNSNPGVKVIWRGIRNLEGAIAMYRILKGKDVGNG